MLHPYLQQVWHWYVHEVWNWIYYVYGGAIVVLAMFKGGWRERAVALTWTVPDGLIPTLIRAHLCSSWCLGGARPLSAWLSLSCDLVMLGVCALAAVRADRYWVIWAGAAALLSVLSDALAIAAPGLVTALGYFFADQIWWFAIGAAVIWGCFGRRPGVATPVRA
jgi:hypothetical protein